MNVGIGHFAQKRRFRFGYILPFTGGAGAETFEAGHRCLLGARRPLQRAGAMRRGNRKDLRVVRIVVEQRIVNVLRLMGVAEEFDVFFLYAYTSKKI